MSQTGCCYCHTYALPAELGLCNSKHTAHLCIACRVVKSSGGNGLKRRVVGWETFSDMFESISLTWFLNHVNNIKPI